MTNEVSNFLQTSNLPRSIRSVDDAKKVASITALTPAIALFAKSRIKKVLSHIDPSELIYLFSWDGITKITSKINGQFVESDSNCVIFFSDKRFFFMDDMKDRTTVLLNGMLQFPIEEITEVLYNVNYPKWLTIESEKFNIEYQFDSNRKNIALVAELILHISDFAKLANQPALEDEVIASTDMLDAASQPGVVDCSGCGSVVTIASGNIDTCEHCGSVAEKPQIAVVPVAPSTTSSTSVADEIKKYKELLDMGVINAEEFEATKNKLLTQL